MKNKLICKVCGREFKRYCDVSSHVSRIHKISVIDYYNKYFKKENEDREVIRLQREFKKVLE